MTLDPKEAAKALKYYRGVAANYPSPEVMNLIYEEDGWNEATLEQWRYGQHMARIAVAALEQAAQEPDSQDNAEHNVAETKLRIYLDCSHCGGVAIYSDDGFTDGDGDKCITCGMPGSVHCDSETPPEWVAADDPDVRCDDRKCEECYEERT